MGEYLKYFGIYRQEWELWLDVLGVGFLLSFVCARKIFLRPPLLQYTMRTAIFCLFVHSEPPIFFISQKHLKSNTCGRCRGTLTDDRRNTSIGTDDVCPQAARSTNACSFDECIKRKALSVVPSTREAKQEMIVTMKEQKRFAGHPHHCHSQIRKVQGLPRCRYLPSEF